MNETTSQAVTENVFRRFEEPVRLFGNTLPPWVWGLLLGIVLALGFFYIGWMYLRDSKGIGPWWASLLGLLRAAVYILLALVFLMPATQTWHNTSQRSKVVVLYDVSLSLSQTRDDIPAPGESFTDLKTRQDKVLDFLLNRNPEFRFMERLESRNPVTSYRFSRGLDEHYLHFEGGRFFPRAEREKILAARGRGDDLPSGYVPEELFWRTWLLPDRYRTQELPEGWKDDEARARELIRQVRDNDTKYSARFFEATAIGESLLETVKQERNNMVQGIIVFTDGRLTEGSQSSIREAMVAAEDAEIPIFVVQVGEARKKVAIDIVDLGVPPLIRPEDKFRAVLTVNGHDMEPNIDGFEVFLDVVRFARKPDGELELKDFEFVPLDEKGQIIKEDGKNALIPSGKKKITLTTADAKEKPVFKVGNPPTCQVEFELDAAKLAKAAGLDVMGDKIGIAPDPDTELRFVARIPKDKREFTEKTEHVSDSADMRVLEKPLRILVVTSAGGLRDYQFLRTLLVREEDKQRTQVCIHIQTIPGSERRDGIVQDIPEERMLKYFPTRRAPVKDDDPEKYYSLSSYDVVVAFDVDWSQLSPDQSQMLSDWVFKDGGGLVFVAGPLHTKPVANPLKLKAGRDPATEKPRDPHIPIYEMLPVQIEFSTREEETKTDEPHRLTFPQATADMEFMRLDETLPPEQWRKAWDKFFNEIQDDEAEPKMVPETETPERGFYTYYPTHRMKDNAMRLAAVDSPTALMAIPPDGDPGAKDLKQPFLARGPWGQGKVFWIASAEIWRLRMYKDAYHERFWTKLLREVGSASANTANRRITPIMSRYGTVNKYQTFEARFEDVNGVPLKRNPAMWPRLIVTEPEGVLPEKGRLVRIKQGDHAGKEAKVNEVFIDKDPAAGAETRWLKVTVFLDDKDKSKVTDTKVESNKVEIINDPIDFKPRLGEEKKEDDAFKKEEMNKKNDGWFKVEFQPKAPGEYKLRVEYKDADDNFYNHKFVVRDSNPETDNVKPDPELLWEMASPATAVLARIEDEKVREAVRGVLKRPDPAKPAADAQDQPKPEPAKVGEEKSSDQGTRLLFNLESARYIPDCMKKRESNVRNRGRIDDMWDDGFFEVETESGEKKPLLPYVLCIAVGLLSAEWLIRKLLRLA